MIMKIIVCAMRTISILKPAKIARINRDPYTYTRNLKVSNISYWSFRIKVYPEIFV